VISAKPTSGESARFHLSDYRLVARHNFGLPIIWELSSGCLEVKYAPDFALSGDHYLDAQKIHALVVKRPRSKGVPHCLLSDRKLHVQISRRMLSGPNVKLRRFHDPLFCRMQNPFENMFLSSRKPESPAGRASIDEL
jgi:hypothetical protein